MKISKKIKIWGIILLIVIILTNITPLKYIIRIFERDFGYYQYVMIKEDAIHFSWEHGLGPDELGWFGGRRDTNYTREHPEILTDTLYRNFWKNPLVFWHWRDYFFDERYTLPYLDRDKAYTKTRSYRMKHANK
jgi:hypothetical protein